MIFNLKIEQLNDLIDRILSAIDYYNKYYKFYLGVCISTAYIGWMLNLISSNWGYIDELKKSDYKVINSGFILAAVLMIVLSFCM